ncbi:hypothetical protein K402DRAFT_459307 [Aulographum hederae CBS 113979]|uniref:U6 snRNA phosphodiesterase n=1 Tax=Aulographum hederae CBS 113979 TaxID=1176131 RepID=A0A6G1HGG1_9PEZI|nr:hypothetical protein K402DRAFT_459307 [Aulographum hederae CBS 113979]
MALPLRRKVLSPAPHKPALVDYSDSDDDGRDEKPLQPPPLPAQAGLKRKRSASPPPPPPTLSSAPSLPPSFFDMYATNPRVGTSDDPALHGGRKRAVPHKKGNWPSHVYLEWRPSDAAFEALTATVEAVKASYEEVLSQEINSRFKVNSLLSELGVPQPLHISLSSSFILRDDNKDAFRKVLTEKIEKDRTISPLCVQFTDLSWFPNENKSRWFLVLCVKQQPASQGSIRTPCGSRSAEPLDKVLRLVNGVMRSWELPTLYLLDRDTPTPFEPKTRHRAIYLRHSHNKNPTVQPTMRPIKKRRALFNTDDVDKTADSSSENNVDDGLAELEKLRPITPRKPHVGTGNRFDNQDELNVSRPRSPTASLLVDSATFHISIAETLSPPPVPDDQLEMRYIDEALAKLNELNDARFDEVKLKTGNHNSSMRFIGSPYFTKPHRHGEKLE